MDGQVDSTDCAATGNQYVTDAARADIEVSLYDSDNRVTDEECFNPESCCDVHEKAVIAQLRELLRPTCAPKCLVTRLQEMLDRCCLEETRGGEALSA
jgi:hypothetical protein